MEPPNCPERVFYVLGRPRSPARGGPRNIVRSAFALLVVLSPRRPLRRHEGGLHRRRPGAHLRRRHPGAHHLRGDAHAPHHGREAVERLDARAGRVLGAVCLLFSLVVVILSRRSGADPDVASSRPRPGRLRQYAGGRRSTGLARGGTAFQDSIVRRRRGIAPEPEAETIEFKAGWANASPDEVGAGRRTYGYISPPRRGRLAVRHSQGDHRTARVVRRSMDFQQWTHRLRGAHRAVAMALAGPYLFAFRRSRCCSWPPGGRGVPRPQGGEGGMIFTRLRWSTCCSFPRCLCAASTPS